MLHLPKGAAGLAIALAFSLFPILALGQPGPGALSGQVIQLAPPTGTGGPAAFATVRVCPTTALGTPCSPTSNLFADQALTQPVPNPYTTDQYGNYSFYLTAGYYIVQISPLSTVTYSYNPVATSDGTVTSVGLALPVSVFSISGSPVNGSGTLTGSFINQSANQVFGNCTTGSAVPAFCSITVAMLPALPPSIIPWATPGTIGSTTPNTGVFTTLAANTSFNTPAATITALTVTTGGSLAGTFTGSPTFSGAPIFSGTPNFTAGLDTTTVISDTANAASAGSLRLARTDSINWRNASNSADEGLTTDAVDALVISHAGGITLTGASSVIHFGGETSSFPMFLRSGTTIQARLADNSGDAPISAALGTFSNHIAVDGVTINASSPSTNQVLTATSSSAASWQALAASQVQQRNLFIQGGTVGIAASTSTTTVQTHVITMPSTGCPCSVYISWGQFVQQGASGQTIGWVNDGTSSMATGLVAAPGTASLLFMGGASWSPNLYANSATPTFNLIESQDVGGGSNNALASSGFGTSGQQNSWMSVVVFTNSN